MTTYGAITPARDEEKFLPGLINSMLSQTRLPLRWIVIDDGSADSTPRLLDDLASRHKWVIVHHVAVGGQRQPGGETVLQRFLSPELWDDCDVIFRRGRRYQFRARLRSGDAGRIPPRSPAGYRQRHTCTRGAGRMAGNQGAEIPYQGAIKMYSRACLTAIGGMEAGLGWDTIDEARAAFVGFTTKNFRYIHARHHRPQGSATGIVRGRWPLVGRPINADIRHCL